VTRQDQRCGWGKSGQLQFSMWYYYSQQNNNRKYTQQKYHIPLLNAEILTDWLLLKLILILSKYLECKINYILVYCRISLHATHFNLVIQTLNKFLNQKLCGVIHYCLKCVEWLKFGKFKQGCIKFIQNYSKYIRKVYFK